jgi:hypothetical protein
MATRTYSIPFALRHEGIVPAGAFPFVLWAPEGPGRSAYLRNVHVVCMFDGDAAVSPASQYVLRRFRAAGPPSEAAPIVAVAHNAADLGPNPANPVKSAYAGFLAPDGIKMDVTDIDEVICYLGCPRGPGASVSYSFAYEPPETSARPFILANGDGLAMQLGAAAAAGDVVYGVLTLDESSTV